MEFDFASYGQSLEVDARDMDYVVFLCGPKISGRTRPANFRRKLKRLLIKEKFRVVLGEDDGLVDIGQKYSINAQTNELIFLRKTCKAVLIIAESPGAHCELGLFSQMKAKELNHLDFFVFLGNQYETETSYINEGPIKMVKELGGHVHYVDYTTFDPNLIVEHLISLRTLRG